MYNDQEFDLVRALRVLRRQWRLIAVTFVVVSGLAALVVFSLAPAFTASVMILVDPSDKNLLDPGASTRSGASADARVDSEVQIIMSESALLRLIDEAGLRQDPEFMATTGTIDRLLHQFNLTTPRTLTADEETAAVLSKVRRAVRATRNGLTYLISIAATADDRQTATRIANTLASGYIKAQVESKVAAMESSRDIIQRRVAEASATVIESEEVLDNFIASSIDQIVAETGRTDLELLRSELEALNDTRERLSGNIDSAERSLALEDWGAVAQTLRSEALAGYEARQRELQAQLVAATAGSETEANLKAELSRVVANLRSSASSAISALRDSVTTTQARAADLQLTLRSSIMASNLPPAIVTNIYELQQTAELARSQYQTLLARLKDLEAQAFLQVADSRVVSEAILPDAPSFPDTKLLLALAAFGALGLGIGLALLRENVVGGFASDTQLSSVLKLPVVSTIPALEPVADNTGGVRTTTLANQIIVGPFTHYSESIRRVQVGVDQAIRRRRHQKDRRGAVIMIGSANASEGKTTLSMSLVRAYALSGRRAILIDCDLRKPSVHTHIGIEPSPRLLDYLGQVGDVHDLDSLVVKDGRSEARLVIGARKSDMQGRQAVTGEFFDRLIEEARDTFDIVILDTPPVGAVVDGLHLAQFADVVVLVTRYGTTPQREARAALEALTDAKREDAEILGVLSVAEQSRRANKRRYGSYYTEG